MRTKRARRHEGCSMNRRRLGRKKTKVVSPGNTFVWMGKFALENKRENLKYYHGEDRGERVSDGQMQRRFLEMGQPHHGNDISMVAVSITTVAMCQRRMSKVMNRLKLLGILVLNAGGSGGESSWTPWP